MVHKNDSYERLSLYVCVTYIIGPHHHKTTHCRKNGNDAIIVGLSSTAEEFEVPIFLTHRS